MPAAGTLGKGRVLESGEGWESESEGGPAPRSLLSSVRVARRPRAEPGPVPAGCGVEVRTQATDASDHEMRVLVRGT